MTDEWTKVQSDVWNPDEGAEISGVYLEKATEVGQNKSNLYKIEVEPGKVVGIWGCKVLDDALVAVKIGSQVKIKFKGKVKPEHGNEYKAYDVFTK